MLITALLFQLTGFECKFHEKSERFKDFQPIIIMSIIIIIIIMKLCTCSGSAEICYEMMSLQHNRSQARVSAFSRVSLNQLWQLILKTFHPLHLVEVQTTESRAKCTHAHAKREASS